MRREQEGTEEVLLWLPIQESAPERYSSSGCHPERA
jgi:hypothetical protein